MWSRLASAAVLALALLFDAAAAPAAPCGGDCDASGRISVDELVRGVRIALGAATADTCPSVDRDADAVVSIDELVMAVGLALGGCPTASPTPSSTPPATATRRATSTATATRSGTPTATAIHTPQRLVVETLADSGPGSLRARLSEAQSGDTIAFAVRGVIRLSSGPLRISHPIVLGFPSPRLTIEGPGAESLAISGDGRSRVIEVVSGLITLRGVTVRDGLLTPNEYPPPAGAGIFNAGYLLVQDCIVRDNHIAPSDDGYCRYTCGSGAGIASTEWLRLERSWVVDNDAGNGLGGGIATRSGTLELSASTVSGNRAGGGGGGLWLDYDPAPNLRYMQATLRNSTVSGNLTDGVGGGIGSYADLRISFSTVAANSAAQGGGVAFPCVNFRDCVYSGWQSHASIVAAQLRGGNCWRAAEERYSPSTASLDDDASCDFVGDDDRSGVADAGLAALDAEPGAPPSHRLRANSPAIDIVPTHRTAPGPDAPLVCANRFEADGLTGDQRGAPRPIGERCDSGAVERQPDDE